jgi:DNA polymerase-3 subunit epsilon
MREIVFDTETTGISHKEHRVIEIGAVEIVDKMPTGNYYHQFINPERLIEAGAMKVHGITDERVANEPIFAEVAHDFLNFVGDSPVVAHNASFDMNFMNMEYRLLDMPEMTNEVVDTLAIARAKFPGSRASLDALCKRFEVDNTSRVYHGALLDAELLAEVYMHLLGGLQQGLILNKEDEDAGMYKASSLLDLVGKDVRPARDLGKASGADLKNHSKFISGVKGAFWEPQPEKPAED